MNPIHCEIDLDQDGKHQGHLRVPHSVHRSAYGYIPIPIASIKNGQGPTALLMAGNHGDEYEGQVSLCRLLRDTDPNQINGQIILLPMANYPAAKAGLRTSPIDDGNLNRSFPGDPYGTPTQVIAHYIEHHLLTRADHLLDLHSGGSSLQYRPTLIMGTFKDPNTEQLAQTLRQSLGFEHIILIPESKNENYSSSAALRQNALPITAELAGGGTINSQATQFLDQSLKRYLHQLNILTTPPNTTPQPSTYYQIPNQDYYIHTDREGLFEPLIDIGQPLTQHQHIANIHNPEQPLTPPHPIYAPHQATTLCKRIPAKVLPGDCLFQLAKPIPKPT